MGCKHQQKINLPTDLQQETANKNTKQRSLYNEDHTSLGHLSLTQQVYPRILPESFLSLLCTAINRSFFLKDDDWRKNNQFASDHDLELKCVYQFMFEKVQNQTMLPRIPYIICFELTRSKKVCLFGVFGERIYFSFIKGFSDEPQLHQLKDLQKFESQKLYSYEIETDFAFFSKTPFFRIYFQTFVQQQAAEQKEQKVQKLKTLLSQIYKKKTAQEIEQLVKSNEAIKIDVFKLNENVLNNNIFTFTNIMQNSDLNEAAKQAEIFGENPEISQIEIYELGYKLLENTK